MTLFKCQNCFSGAHSVGKVAEEEARMIGKRRGLFVVITFHSPLHGVEENVKLRSRCLIVPVPAQRRAAVSSPDPFRSRRYNLPQ